MSAEPVFEMTIRPSVCFQIDLADITTVIKEGFTMRTIGHTFRCLIEVLQLLSAMYTVCKVQPIGHEISIPWFGLCNPRMAICSRYIIKFEQLVYYLPIILRTSNFFY